MKSLMSRSDLSPAGGGANSETQASLGAVHSSHGLSNRLVYISSGSGTHPGDAGQVALQSGDRLCMSANGLECVCRLGRMFVLASGQLGVFQGQITSLYGRNFAKIRGSDTS
ncbi:hypothetical protein RRG08_038301 [Elysia crispata]|uniref:Uncharacterized protein n=1 Tax=Elysia crispata TaxID=231223 RepID=A0AAE1ANH2_9GAST|nr:hypothetical protein RRG08_038301 [Elysia crispata]